MYTPDDVLQALRGHGLKVTAQRRAIVRTLAGDESHPSAQAIYERLHGEHPDLSFNTVYTTLSTLVEAGLVRQVAFDGERSRFDPKIEPHHHAVCTRCGAVRDVPLPRRLPRRPGRVVGFRVDAVEWVYRGLCPACQSSKRGKHPRKETRA